MLGPPGDIALATGGIVYELTVRDLNEVSISRAITVETTRIDTPRLDVTLSGFSIMTAAGTADEQRIDISGPSRYEAAGLQSREVWITASGPSTTTVRVSERLVVNISNPAVVEYFGNPEVTVTGGGTVRQVGD